MGNPLSVRRVKIVTINEQGEPEDDQAVSFGVMAADDEAQTYADYFKSLAELNAAINEAESILAVADPDGSLFAEADHAKIGRDNFYGKDWTCAES